jgi:hypothetical protein
MRSLNWRGFVLLLGLAGGCEILVDPDPNDVGGEVTENTNPSSDRCADTKCPSGSHCELVAVQCITTPCDPVPECVPDTQGTDAAAPDAQACGKATCAPGLVCCNPSCGICTEPGGVCIQLACEETRPEPVTTCAATLCLEGSTCIDSPEGATCLPNEENPCNLLDCPPNRICKVLEGAAACVVVEDEPSTCAATLCAVGTYCDDISGKAECLPLPSCKGTSCESGTHCELVDVQCVRAPCPPQPECVADADPCAALDCANCKVVNGKAKCGAVDTCSDPCTTARCGSGTHCEALEVDCFAAPCCPVATCVTNSGSGEKCGENTCKSGTYCCNESCGTCAPQGGACTQQWCGATD